MLDQYRKLALASWITSLAASLFLGTSARILFMVPITGGGDGEISRTSTLPLPPQSTVHAPHNNIDVLRFASDADHASVFGGIQGDHRPSVLAIPTLDIEAMVRPVGIDADGNMATPGNFDDVGWYEGGVMPGEHGSAVIDGHFDNAMGFAAVFRRLSEVKIGDTIDIGTHSGWTLTFIVFEIASYPRSDVPLERLFARESGNIELNLITCSGDWIRSEQTYDERLVVYARLVSARAP